MDALSELISVYPGAKIYTDSITGMFCCKNFCRQYDVFLETFTFQQVSAPARRARDIELLRRSTPDFIAPDMWPPNSPDLNPVDYAILSIMHQRVYQTRVRFIKR